MNLRKKTKIKEKLTNLIDFDSRLTLLGREKRNTGLVKNIIC